MLNRETYLTALATLATVMACLFVTPTSAAPPWADFVKFRTIEADADKTYGVTRENGPWMIMATTFRGPAATEDAQALVHELRREYKLSAYTHSVTYDYSEGFVGRGVDKYGDPRRMRHLNNEKINEVAVLVGDYASVDDARAQKDLKRLKTFQPKTLIADEGQETSQTFSGLREMHRKLLTRQPDKKSLGPMRLAFVTTNPLMPETYFRPQGIDRFVTNLNRSKKYSLLECDGNYTVKVATFKGYVVNSQTLRESKDGSWGKSRLEEGARKAHRLTVALRAKGYEAYQFHDRDSSIVTVGAFRRPPVHSADGSVKYEPQVRDLIHRFGAKQKTDAIPNPQGPSLMSQIQPATLLSIPFDVYPTLIPVPKQSLSRTLAQ